MPKSAMPKFAGPWSRRERPSSTRQLKVHSVVARAFWRVCTARAPATLFLGHVDAIMTPIPRDTDATMRRQPGDSERRRWGFAGDKAEGAGDCSIAQDRPEKGGVGKSRAIRTLAADDQFLLPLLFIWIVESRRSFRWRIEGKGTDLAGGQRQVQVSDP